MVKIGYCRKSIRRLLLFVLVSSIILFSHVILASFAKEVSSDSNDLTTAYWDLIDSPIYIDDLSPNDNWETTAFENIWCTGEGTLTDPYVIQDVIVSSTDSDCITILHSEVYFIITNCIIINSQKELGAGISLQDVKNGYIRSSQISNCDSYGITMGGCTNIIVYNNTIFGNGWMGIYLFKGLNCEISENTIYNNSGIGVSVFQSNFTRVIENDIYSHYTVGIGGEFCVNSEIKHNNIYDNYDGINMHESSYNTFLYNSITDNTESGLQLRYNSDYNTISDNTFFNNKYCIVIGTSCSNNEIYNNGVCDMYTIDDGGDGGGDDGNNGNGTPSEELDIPGYNMLFFIGVISIVSVLIYFKYNKIMKR